MPELISIEAIRDAARRLNGVAYVTPVLTVHLAGCPPLRVKCENLQPVGAFKIRGAYNMIAKLDPGLRRRGVITYSSGNHGQAVAFAARQLGAPAVVVMPTTTPAIKVERTRAFGAEVLFEGTTSVDRKRRAEAEAAARGLTIVPPFDHPDIIAGQGTAGLEILRQVPDVKTIVVPVGGGGFLAGISAAVRAEARSVRLIGVEPSGSASMTASVAAGHVVKLEHTASVADGLLTLAPGELTFAHVRALVDEIVTVEEDQIIEAMLALFRDARLVVEPSGAASVAAVRVLAQAAKLSDGPVVAVLSGGNIDLERFNTLAASLRKDTKN